MEIDIPSYSDETVESLKRKLRKQGIKFKSRSGKRELYNLLYNIDEEIDMWASIPDRTTVSQIKAQLDMRDIKYKSKDKKDDLLELLREDIERSERGESNERDESNESSERKEEKKQRRRGDIENEEKKGGRHSITAVRLIERLNRFKDKKERERNIDTETKSRDEEKYEDEITYKFILIKDIDELLRANGLDETDYDGHDLYSFLPDDQGEKMRLLNAYMSQFDILYYPMTEEKKEVKSEEKIEIPTQQLMFEPPQFYTYSELSDILKQISGKSLKQLEITEIKETESKYDSQARVKIINKINFYYSNQFHDTLPPLSTLVNEKNVYFATRDECDDIIYYGDKNKCRWYSANELRGYFKRNNRFYDDDNKIEFSEDEILTLLSISVSTGVPSGTTDKYPDLYQIIRTITEKSILLPSRQQKLMKKLQSKKKFIKILRMFFEIGMTMRKWKKGESYPLKKVDTGKTTDAETRKRVELLLPPFITILSKCNEKNVQRFKNLCIMNLEGGKYMSQRDLTIGDIIEGTITGTEVGSLTTPTKSKTKKPKNCIRVASKYIISTSIFYLNRIYSEIIPGVDITKLDSIG